METNSGDIAWSLVYQIYILFNFNFKKEDIFTNYWNNFDYISWLSNKEIIEFNTYSRREREGETDREKELRK